MPTTSIPRALANSGPKRQAFLAALDAALTPERFAELMHTIVQSLLPGELEVVSPALEGALDPVDSLVHPRNPFVPLTVGELTADALASLAAHVHADDLLCFMLACSAFRLAGMRALGPRGQLKTWKGALCATPTTPGLMLLLYPILFG